MTTYSQGIGLLWRFAEEEARTFHFDAVLPEHLWMGLTSLCELEEESLSHFPADQNTETKDLKNELYKLKEWLCRWELEPSETRRILRKLLGQGRGYGGTLQGSIECIALQEEAARLAAAEGASVADATHLARAIVRNPPLLLMEHLVKIGLSSAGLAPAMPDVRIKDMSASARPDLPKPWRTEEANMNRRPGDCSANREGENASDGDRQSDRRDTLLLSSIPAVSEMEAALLVLDIAESTKFVCESGDTIFTDVISRINDRFLQNRSSPHLIFLKCTGDGFLAVYRTAVAALSMGSDLLETEFIPGLRARIALHWGRIRIGPKRDPLGVEVHRVFRMESVKEDDLVGDIDPARSLPQSTRILASRAAVDRLNYRERARFRRLGKFTLKGFDTPSEIWMFTTEDTDLTLSAAGFTQPGKKRRHNEDAYLCDPASGTFIVADGMGGKVAGETASTAVTTVLPALVEERLRNIQDAESDRIESAIVEAICKLSDNLHSKSYAFPTLRGLGSTVAWLLIRDCIGYVAYVGDSRVYLFRDGKLSQLSEDQTTAAALERSGCMTQAGTLYHSLRHSLEEYLGKTPPINPGIRSERTLPCDRWVLCSDGLTRGISDDEMAAVFNLNLDPRETCRRLVRDANAADGSDDMSVVVVDVV